jgi:hypothetical protein
MYLRSLCRNKLQCPLARVYLASLWSSLFIQLNQVREEPVEIAAFSSASNSSTQ